MEKKAKVRITKIYKSWSPKSVPKLESAVGMTLTLAPSTSQPNIPATRRDHRTGKSSVKPILCYSFEWGTAIREMRKQRPKLAAWLESEFKDDKPFKFDLMCYPASCCEIVGK